MAEGITTKEYELAFLAAEESGAPKVSAAIAKNGGGGFLPRPVERIALEYKIKKATSAYFGFLHFRMAPMGAKALEHEMNVMPGILRFLIITPPFVKTKPRIARPWSGIAPAAASLTPSDRVEREQTSLPISNEALEKKIEEILGGKRE